MSEGRLEGSPSEAPTLSRRVVEAGETLPPTGLVAAPPGGPAAPAGYEILGELGRGGMGVVYKARQIGLNRLVALKMILGGPHAGAEELARFKTEAEAIARLKHPNIVAVYEVGEHEGKPFFSLEFCEGGSLDRKLAGNPLPPEQAAELVEALAGAVQAAHQANVIHRDLKPANVLLTNPNPSRPAPSPPSPRSGEGESEGCLAPPLRIGEGVGGRDLGVPKITDFGLAKKLDEAGMTQSGAIMGTPSYMAPEQAAGKKDIAPAADVYALGAILYECLTGRPPFKGPTSLDTVLQVLECEAAPPRLLNPAVPRDLETICLKCLEKDPARRYTSAELLALDLGRFRAGDEISARSYNLLARLARNLERSPIDAGFAAWGNLLLVWSAIVLLTHLISFTLLLMGGNVPLSNGAGYVLQFALMGLTYGWLRPRRTRPSGASEHQLWVLWVGYLTASFVLLAVWQMIPELRTDRLQWVTYPMAALLAGLAFFSMGGSHWGPGYAFGLAFFALAAVMPWRLDFASLEFGALWALALAAIGRRLRRLVPA